ncbi:hypothetical protein [Zobellia nedashkovskayae]|nr:hypothetical protein [Zobellia nedashkovskayae]
MKVTNFNNIEELTIDEQLEIGGGEWWCPYCWVDAVRDYFSE